MLPPLVIDGEDLDDLVGALRRVLPPLVAAG